MLPDGNNVKYIAAIWTATVPCVKQAACSILCNVKSHGQTHVKIW